MPEFHAEAPQATVSEELAQGPYVAAREGVEPMTLRTKGADSTNALPMPQCTSPFKQPFSGPPIPIKEYDVVIVMWMSMLCI